MDQSLCARWDALAKHASAYDVLGGPTYIWLPRLCLANARHVVELPRYTERILAGAPYAIRTLRPPLNYFTLTLPKHEHQDRACHALRWFQDLNNISILKFRGHPEAIEAHRALVTLVVDLLRDMGRA